MDQERVKMGLLRFNDELAGLIKSFNKYSQGRGSDEEFLLELYDGKGFNTIRMEENRYCEETAVTIFGGGQPEVLTKLHRGQDANGLWARFIFDFSAAVPKRLPTVITAEEKSKFRKEDVIVCGSILPTIKDSTNKKNLSIYRKNIHISHLERTKKTLEYNNLLKEKCSENGYKYPENIL